MATPEEFTGPTTELLQSLIRNQCVNDGTPDSGEETRNSDLLVDYLEGAGLDVERFTPRPGRDSMVARIEGSDPDAPSLCLMGHTDVVPVNADGWRHDPFAGRGDRRRGVGSWCDRHAQSHVVDGRRVQATRHGGVPAEGRPDLLRRRRRGGRWRVGSRVDGRPPLGRDRGRLRAHRTRWLVVGRPRRHAIGHGQRRREGSGVASPAHLGYTRPRIDAVRLGQRPRQGRRGRPADRRLSPGGAHRRPVDRAGRRDALARRSPDGTQVTRHDLGHAGRVARAGRPHLPRPHPHDVLAERRARRPEDQHDPRHGRHRRRHPHGARHDARGRRPTTSAKRSAICTTRSSSACCSTPIRRAAISVRATNCGTPSRRTPRSPIPNAKLIPGLIVGGTDARFYRERGKVAYGAGLFSPEMDFASFGTRFHGNDERIDTASLGLSGNYFYGIAKELARLTARRRGTGLVRSRAGRAPSRRASSVVHS